MAVAPQLPLLEREHQLDRLRAAFDGASRGVARLVRVAGEAGAGKPAPGAGFRESLHEGARILEGACDSLSTPRPLAPVADLVHLTGGRLEAVVEGGGRAYEVLPPLL